MAHVLFVSIPMTGHLSPAVAVASALDRASRAPGGRVASVRFAGLAGSRARVEAGGLEFVDLGEPPEEDQARFNAMSVKVMGSKRMYGITNGGAAFIAAEKLMTPRLLDAIRGGPAAGTTHVVADCATIAGMDAAEVLGLPLVLLHQVPLGMALAITGNSHYNLPSHVPLDLPSPLMQPAQLTWLQRAANPVLKRAAAHMLNEAPIKTRREARISLGLPVDVDLALFAPAARVPAQCHIVSGSTHLEVERPLPPGWHISGHHNIDFSGTNFPVAFAHGDATADSTRGFIAEADAAGVPVVYVALGTLVRPTAQQLAALGSALAALQGARVIWALRKDFHADVPPEALAAVEEGRILLLNYAPQHAILSHPSVKLFVTHGGLNSTYEGAAAGKAMIVMPFFADQPVNAQHVVDKGLGAIADPWNSTAADLTAKMMGVLGDAATQARAAAVGAQLRLETGAATAARLILQFVHDTPAAAASGTPPH